MTATTATGGRVRVPKQGRQGGRQHVQTDLSRRSALAPATVRLLTATLPAGLAPHTDPLAALVVAYLLMPVIRPLPGSPGALSA